MRVILVFLLLFLHLVCLAKQATAQIEKDYERFINEGITSYENGEYLRAEKIFLEVLTAKVHKATAHYWLARIYLQPSVKKPGEAFRHLGKARDIEPENSQFLLERLRQLSSGYSFFRGSRKSERLGIVDKIIKIDSTQSVAYHELGKIYFDEFKFYRSVRAREIGDGGWTINPANWNYDKALEAVETAVVFYFKAIKYDNQNLTLYREMISLSVQAARSFGDRSKRYYDLALKVGGRIGTEFPESSETWKLRGMLFYLTGCNECASAQFEHALGMMTSDERNEFDTIEILLGSEASDMSNRSVDSLAQSYWQKRETQHLTRYNERQISHYSRIVYADLFYEKWRRYINDPDHITPGDVILRYGVPDKGEFRIAPRIDNKLRYWPAQLRVGFSNTEETFLFTDYSSAGDWSIFSERNDFDPVTKAQSIFFETPELESPRISSFTMPFQYWRMRDESSQPELIVTFGVPVVNYSANRDVPVSIQTGVFLVDDENIKYDYVVENHLSLKRTHVILVDSVNIWTKTVVVTPKNGKSSIFVEGKNEYLTSSNKQDVTYDYIGDKLDVSDPLFAIGIEDGDEPWTNEGINRNGLTILPSPISSFKKGHPIYIYYEIYNLSQDSSAWASYRTEVVLLPIKEGGIVQNIKEILGRNQEIPVAVSFESTVKAPRDAQYKILDTSTYDPGHYHLIVRIIDSLSNEVASSGKDVYIR